MLPRTSSFDAGSAARRCLQCDGSSSYTAHLEVPSLAPLPLWGPSRAGRAGAERMSALQQFTRSEVLRIVGITPGQLKYWERLELVETPREAEPAAGTDQKAYNFRHLTRLRVVKQLTGQRVPARRLRTALDAFRRQGLTEAEAPFDDVRLVPAGRRIVVEYQGTRIEPVTGQLVLDFGGTEAKVSAIRQRSLEDWLNVAQECEGNSALRSQAIDAYCNIVERAPVWLEPRLNLGTLYYEDGNLAAAAEQFRVAVDIAPGNPLAHFNRASVLDDLNELEAAARHFEEALRLAPGFADAHYNAARVYERLGAASTARVHWKRYLELDPSSAWSDYARQRLEELNGKSDSALPLGISS
jgi:tetratricopeptide (TPR) repeat protein